jgi:hypothetical protein
MTKGGAWHIEESSHDGSGARTWDIVDDRDGVWGSFFDRVTATACLAGFKAIDFIPRPEEVTRG